MLCLIAGVMRRRETGLLTRIPRYLRERVTEVSPRCREKCTALGVQNALRLSKYCDVNGIGQILDVPLQGVLVADVMLVLLSYCGRRFLPSMF